MNKSTIDDNLVIVEDLKKHFPIKKGFLFARQVGAVKAVDGVTFNIKKGETLGLVGESGCGKSTLGRCLLRLIEPTDGKIYFDGVDLRGLNRGKMRDKRQDMQIVFQDPQASLNPRMPVGEIIGEPLTIFGIARGEKRKKMVRELMDTVGINPDSMNRYPHEFSGGQKQRIGVARALALQPKLIVCDEPVSALDVSIQAQVVNLLQDLQKQMDLTYLFIAHDLAVIKHISDRIAVMYLGKIVEMCDGEDLYSNPMHPYTEALMSAIPIPDPDAPKDRILLEGDVPSPVNPPPGCPFHTRCPKAYDKCKTDVPRLLWGPGDHLVVCHLYDEGGERENKDYVPRVPFAADIAAE